MPRMHRKIQDRPINSNSKRGGYGLVMLEFLGKITGKMCVRQGDQLGR